MPVLVGRTVRCGWRSENACGEPVGTLWESHLTDPPSMFHACCRPDGPAGRIWGAFLHNAERGSLIDPFQHLRCGRRLETVRRAVRVPRHYCAVAGNCCAHGGFIWIQGRASEQRCRRNYSRRKRAPHSACHCAPHGVAGADLDNFHIWNVGGHASAARVLCSQGSRCGGRVRGWWPRVAWTRPSEGCYFGCRMAAQLCRCAALCSGLGGCAGRHVGSE